MYIREKCGCEKTSLLVSFTRCGKRHKKSKNFFQREKFNPLCWYILNSSILQKIKFKINVATSHKILSEKISDTTFQI